MSKSKVTAAFRPPSKPTPAPGYHHKQRAGQMSFAEWYQQQKAKKATTVKAKVQDCFSAFVVKSDDF